MIYRTITYFLLGGLLVPSFADYGYYFYLNEVKFSEFTVSMLNIAAYISLLAGILLYQRFFKHYEIRTMLTWSVYLTFLGHFTGLFFVLRLTTYFGINDVFYVTVTTCITDTLSLAFSQLPTLVLYAKITPVHIEATVFAILTGTHNLCASVLSPQVGVWVNSKFVGVTSEDLSRYYILQLIALGVCLLPLMGIRLIPLRVEIEE